MTKEERDDLARRFDRHVVNNMQRDREIVERRLRHLDDTHDEWRELNDVP
jgi:hypothetical protein